MTFIAAVIQQLQRYLSQNFVTKAVITFAVLAFFGSIPDGNLIILLLLFIAVKTLQLMYDGFKPQPDWDGIYQEIYDFCRQLSEQEFFEHAKELGISRYSSVEQLAQAEYNKLRQETPPPTGWREIICEIIGLYSFALLLPLNLFIFSRDFVSPWSSFSFMGYGVLLACIACYWLIKKYIAKKTVKMLFWLTPFIPGLLFFSYGVAIKHPYINPFNPDKIRLRAEKVIALQDNVAVANYWFWVFEYAQQLQTQGFNQEALNLFEYIQTLVPQNRDVSQLIARLQNKHHPTDTDYTRQLAVKRAYTPVWTEEQIVSPMPNCIINNTLQGLSETTLIVVPVGDVSQKIIDIIGHVVSKELGLPTCISDVSLPLPEYTRFRGLVFGQQWDVTSIYEAFTQTFHVTETNPAIYLMVTEKDIYSNNSNFVFSATFPWGAVMSYKRFDDGDSLLMTQRAAKQAQGALAKALGASASHDPLCVTSYTSNLNEFDNKGNRPTLETLNIVNRYIQLRNHEWRKMSGG